MAKKALPCPTVLRQLLRYEPETGKLFWKRRALYWFQDNEALIPEERCKNWNLRYDGSEAFTSKISAGYHAGKVLGASMRAHRVAWAIATGSWPSFQIDHINGDRADNSLCNLRDVSGFENSKNRSISKANKSGTTGVVWNLKLSKWRAGIGVNGKTKCLGVYDDIQDAIKARKMAEVEFGFHKNNGTKHRAYY